MATQVSVQNVSKTFGTTVAVDNLSFTARANEFVSIVGPSGCGKSTLLRIIAGLIPPSSGTVRVRDRTVTAPISDAGMVFQSAVLLPWRTTLGNILFVAEMRGAEPAKYREKALDLIKLAGLSGFEQRYPFELSGGMQQRVAICRSLLLDPSLILMDEPFGALDVITRERMGFELLKIWSVKRSTVLFVTHSITEAVLLSDTVIVMSPRPGRISETVRINFPRPRTRETLREPDFVALSAHLRDTIEGTERAEVA